MDVEKRESLCTLGGTNGTAIMKTSMRILKKIKIALPYAGSYDPAIPLLGTDPKVTKTLAGKDICTPTFIAALFTIAKTLKQLKCPSIDEWIKKLWYIYNAVLFSH